MGKGDKRHRSRVKSDKPVKPLGDEFALRPSRRRQPNGQHADRTDPRQVALAARCRLLGRADTAEERRAVASQLYESQVGLALALGCVWGGDEAKKLRDVFDAAFQITAVYYSRILNRSMFPSIARLEMEPERIEADVSHTIDDRDEAQKIRDASNNWMRLQGWLGQMDKHERALINDGLFLRRDFVIDRQITTAGQAFVQAMRVLRGIAEK